MDLVRRGAATIDVEAELLALYPALSRRLTLVLRDATEAEAARCFVFVGGQQRDGLEVDLWGPWP